MFITFEGPDGSGKTTQIQLLADYLKSRGFHNFVATKEPGGTAVGSAIRNILLHSDYDICSRTEIFLFAADRAQHVEKVVRPAVMEGTLVLCDRYIDSTFAYQIGGRQLDEQFIESVVLMATDGLTPDKTFYFDVTPETGIRRASRIASADRFERELVAFHQRVRQKYLELAQANPDRFVIFDTENFSIEEVFEQVSSTVRKLVPGLL